jgi:putative membrane protein
MFRFVSAAAFCLSLLAGLVGPAAAAVSSEDTNFAEKAAQGGLAEVKLAALAEQKSKNPTVLAFARRMDRDHTKNNAELATAAKQAEIDIPSDVGPSNKAAMAKLEGLSGSAFDRAYLQAQVTGHKKMLTLLKREISMGQVSQLVAYAKMTEPVVEQHLALAQSDASKMAVSRM